MKIYPNIIENTEVNLKALVEAVVLTEEVETKVGAACCQHHWCCRGHRRLVVHQHRLSGLLGFEIALWQFSIDKPPATLVECLICPVLSAILQGKHCTKTGYGTVAEINTYQIEH